MRHCRQRELFGRSCSAGTSQSSRHSLRVSSLGLVLNRATTPLLHFSDLGHTESRVRVVVPGLTFRTHYRILCMVCVYVSVYCTTFNTTLPEFTRLANRWRVKCRRVQPSCKGTSSAVFEIDFYRKETRRNERNSSAMGCTRSKPSGRNSSTNCATNKILNECCCCLLD